MTLTMMMTNGIKCNIIEEEEVELYHTLPSDVILHILSFVQVSFTYSSNDDEHSLFKRCIHLTHGYFVQYYNHNNNNLHHHHHTLFSSSSSPSEAIISRDITHGIFAHFEVKQVLCDSDYVGFRDVLTNPDIDDEPAVMKQLVPIIMCAHSLTVYDLGYECTVNVLLPLLHRRLKKRHNINNRISFTLNVTWFGRLNKQLNDKLVVKLIESCDVINHLELKGEVVDGLRKFAKLHPLQSLSNLKALTIQFDAYSDLRCFIFLVEKIIAQGRMPNLESLIIPQFFFLSSMAHYLMKPELSNSQYVSTVLPSLQQLSLKDNSVLKDEICKTILECLNCKKSPTLALTHIDFTETGFGDASATYLAINAPNIRIIQIAKSHVTSRGMLTLLKHCHNLRVLNMSCCTVSSTDHSIIESALKQLSKHKNLYSLVMPKILHMSIDWCELIAQNTTLEKLAFSETFIGDAGAIVLSKHHYLKELHLINAFISDEGGQHLLNHNRLQVLNLRDNHITGQTVLNFLNQMLKETSQKNLTALNLSGNSGIKGIYARDLCHKLPHLTNVHIDGTKIGDESIWMLK